MLKLFFILLLSIFSICGAQDIGYDRIAMQHLTEYRLQHRKTIDGYLCAAAFVQDGQTYTDCTAAKAPDETIGREWCYTEYHLSKENGQYWNYCVEVISYDVVRSKARDIFKFKELEMQNALQNLFENKSRLEKIIDRNNQVCGEAHHVVPHKIETVSKAIDSAERTISKLQHSISKIFYLQSKVVDVKESINKNRKEAIQEKTNCQVVRGYEDTPEADGLRGSYYNNPKFEGIPILYRDDKNINFVWDEISPTSNVSIYHFSVRWDGFIKIPEDGNYFFIIESDCGARVFLDDSSIIIDRMPNPIEGDAITDAPVHILPYTLTTVSTKTYSSMQNLIGGNKYRIRVEYFHVSVLKWKNPTISTIKLSWKSESINEQIIPKEYFYKSDPKKSLQISGLPGNLFDLSLLEDGVHAFIDSDSHFISDVMPKFEGAKLIRTEIDPKYTNIFMRVSSPSTLFVAAEKFTNPIRGTPGTSQPVVFSPFKGNISILKSKTRAGKAEKQIGMSIYSAKLSPGIINLSVTPHYPFFMFLLKLRESEEICEGNPIVVSRTDSPTFEDCTSSSYLLNSNDCRAGFSGINKDIVFGTWKSFGGYGVGQFILITFKQPVQLTAFQFKTNNDPSSWPSIIELQFLQDNTVERVNILPGDHTYQIHARVVTGVKAIVIKMADESSSNNTGGSLSYIGTLCNPAEYETAKNDDTISVLFRSYMVGSIPEGYIIDHGNSKKSNSNNYLGWSSEIDPTATPQCDLPPSIEKYRSTGIRFSPDSESCTDKNCSPPSWSIDMVHYGKYGIIVDAGSPCDGNQVHQLSINGIEFIPVSELKKNQFSKVYGELILTSTSTITLTTSEGVTIQSIAIKKISA